MEIEVEVKRLLDKQKTNRNFHCTYKNDRSTTGSRSVVVELCEPQYPEQSRRSVSDPSHRPCSFPRRLQHLLLVYVRLLRQCTQGHCRSSTLTDGDRDGRLSCWDPGNKFGKDGGRYKGSPTERNRLWNRRSRGETSEPVETEKTPVTVRVVEEEPGPRKM